MHREYELRGVAWRLDYWIAHAQIMDWGYWNWLCSGLCWVDSETWSVGVEEVKLLHQHSSAASLCGFWTSIIVSWLLSVHGGWRKPSIFLCSDFDFYFQIQEKVFLNGLHVRHSVSPWWCVEDGLKMTHPSGHCYVCIREAGLAQTYQMGTRVPIFIIFKLRDPRVPIFIGDPYVKMGTPSSHFRPKIFCHCHAMIL